MRHVEEECTLRLVRQLRFFKVRHFAFRFGIDAMETGNHMILEIFVLHEFNLVVNIFVIELQSKVHKIHVLVFDHFENFRRFRRRTERLSIRRMHNGIDKDIETRSEIVDFR